MATEKNCKGCSDKFRHSLEEIKSNIDQLIMAIPEENRADDEEYQSRLDKCRSCCGYYLNATCRYCGCFVQMRAAKKNMDCPNPGGSKW